MLSIGLISLHDHLICLMEMLEDEHYLPPLTNEDTEAERSTLDLEIRLYDLGNVSLPLRASVLSSVKWS